MTDLIITQLNLWHRSCMVCAFLEEQKIREIRLEPIGEKSILGNIYVGEVEKVLQNIQSAFVRFADGSNGYLPLKEAENAIFVSGQRKSSVLKPGHQLLVQVTRDAIKTKLPALTADINLPGKFLVLTARNKSVSFSKKLTDEERIHLNAWVREEQEDPYRNYGIIVRTSAADASKEEFLFELGYLKNLYRKVTQDGIHRTPLSLLYEAEPLYISAIRDVHSQELNRIVTDIPEVYKKTELYLKEFKPDEASKLDFYEDKLLPLNKLYSIQSAIDEIQRERIWLKSGGFVVIEQTEAFVSIDVNTGKYSADKKAEETFRKINLEAAAEIARQIRLRNLSGIILVDFINLSSEDHRDELFHVLQKHLRKDPVNTRAVDVTKLQITEITRKKVRASVPEVLRSLSSADDKHIPE